MFGFYWYLIAAFCAVYRNTQGAFIKDSVFNELLWMSIADNLGISSTNSSFAKQ